MSSHRLHGPELMRSFGIYFCEPSSVDEVSFEPVPVAVAPGFRIQISTNAWAHAGT